MVSKARYPAYREGYYMSTDQQRIDRALVLLNFNETKERLALLKNKSQELAKEFEETARKLKNSPENYYVNTDPEITKYYQELRALTDDIRKTIEEKQRLQTTLVAAGISF